MAKRRTSRATGKPRSAATTVGSRNARKTWRDVKIVVERHDDGYVAYPIGMRGVVVGQGDTYETALADVRSAIVFHAESFGSEAFEGGSDVLEAFIAQTRIAG